MYSNGCNCQRAKTITYYGLFKFYRAKYRADNMFRPLFLCHICARNHSMNSYKFQLRVHFFIIICTCRYA